MNSRFNEKFVDKVVQKINSMSGEIKQLKRSERENNQKLVKMNEKLEQQDNVIIELRNAINQLILLNNKNKRKSYYENDNVLPVTYRRSFNQE